MASFGHIAVGMAAARLHCAGRSPAPRAVDLAAGMLGWSLLSLMPDLDVIGFRLGVAYGDPWGHRGASHSLTAALCVGLSAGIFARLLGGTASRSAIFGLLVAAVVASHGLLDTLTDGGLGCALLWPLDDTRYFAPWNPIPVAPIGRAFFSSTGLRVATTEILLFAPMWLVACWPLRRTSGSERARPPRERAP